MWEVAEEVVSPTGVKTGREKEVVSQECFEARSAGATAYYLRLEVSAWNEVGRAGHEVATTA